MPTSYGQEPDPASEPGPPSGVSRREDRVARRVVVDPGGPVLIEGPVEVDLGDGRTARSDRFMVALCACRRSRTFPWCDTSHRRHSRPAAPGCPEEGGDPDGSGAKYEEKSAGDGTPQ